MLKLLTITFYFIAICSNLFCQPILKEQGRYFESHSFSKISLDETGIWAISGDSSQIYHYDLASTLQNYPQFNTASSKKFTGILAKGSNKVLVATAGDYLLSFNNGVITKLDKSAGILNGKINSLFGDLNNTIVGTDSLAYEAKGNFIFKSKYATTYPDKKTVILNDYMSWEYPYAQKAQQYPGANYYLQFTTPSSMWGVSITLDNDEYPQSSSFYYDGYFHLYIATNKGLNFFDRSYGSIKKSLIDVPTYDLYQYIDNNYHPHIIAATKNGLYIKSVYNINYSDKVLNNLELYDILCLNDRIVWLASNKGLIKMSIVPQLSTNGTINFCESSPQNLQITGTMNGDNVKWYRNDTLTGFGNTTSVTITKGGIYDAVVSNPLFPNADTTAKINFKTDSVNYNFSYAYDTLTICKGGNWGLNLTSTNYRKYYWLRNGEIFSGQQSPLYISEAGFYSALITNCNNISSETRKIEIKTIDKPFITYNYPKNNIICALDTLKLNVNTNADYYYVYGPNYNYSDQKKLNLTQPAYYTFNLNFKNITGCSWKDTVKIDILPLPYAWVEQTGGSVNATSVIKNSVGEVKLSFKIKNYQWYLNNTLVTGATDSILHISQPGLYKVRVTDFNECHNFSNDCKVLALDTRDLKTGEFNVFPNPTSGFFTILTDIPIKVNKIEIYSIEGTLVKCFEKDLVLPYTCDISNLINGMYLVRVVSDKLIQFRIILQK
ncbi:MAG TPA: T9SS type A sorting domain-containing protein [Bacteroidales bacterium]